MGCDIHTRYETKINGEWEWVDAPTGLHWDALEERSYAMFGFLAGVRNYSAVEPLSEPRGVPDGWDEPRGYHSHSWFTIEELLAIDPDSTVEDRRCTIGNNGGCTCDPGAGRVVTLREFLGQAFFDRVQELRGFGVDRVVFWFDS